MSWKNWGDHPLVVGVGVIAGIIAIVSGIFAYNSGKSEDPRGAININVEGANVSESGNTNQPSPRKQSRPSQSRENSPPRVHTYARVLKISEEDCMNSMSSVLAKSGVQDITLVQKGFYGTKRGYNIFVGCNVEVKALFLVVSGSQDDAAKQIREEIKGYLPPE
jgi:hypothetical protein